MAKELEKVAYKFLYSISSVELVYVRRLNCQQQPSLFVYFVAVRCLFDRAIASFFEKKGETDRHIR